MIKTGKLITFKDIAGLQFVVLNDIVLARYMYFYSRANFHKIYILVKKNPSHFISPCTVHVL